jgi:flagellar biosynthesis anti-sigma factor FlgM
MRIVDTSNLGNTTPAQTGRTGELRSIDSGGKAGSGSGKSSSATDSVQLSGFTGRLAQTMQADAASRVQRVTELTAAVRSGSYQADAKAVSHALVNQALSSGSSGKP